MENNSSLPISISTDNMAFTGDGSAWQLYIVHYCRIPEDGTLDRLKEADQFSMVSVLLPMI